MIMKTPTAVKMTTKVTWKCQTTNTNSRHAPSRMKTTNVKLLTYSTSEGSGDTTTRTQATHPMIVIARTAMGMKGIEADDRALQHMKTTVRGNRAKVHIRMMA